MPNFQHRNVAKLEVDGLHNFMYQLTLLLGINEILKLSSLSYPERERNGETSLPSHFSLPLQIDLGLNGGGGETFGILPLNVARDPKIATDRDAFLAR